MSNITQHIEDYINAANNSIASSVGHFYNNLEDIKLIVSDEQKTFIDRQLAVIDGAYQNILEVYKANIRDFVKHNVRVIYALEKMNKGADQCKKS